MNDELDLDLDNIEANAERKAKATERFGQLSEKVILTSKERDEALAKVQTEADRASSAEKERDFYKDFSVNVSKYPNASEYQDKILEKVKSGYSTEDAMVAVLAKEGKLTSAPVQQTMGSQTQVEGGSAPTSFEGSKSLQDMSVDEKLDALKGLNSDDLARALRGK